MNEQSPAENDAGKDDVLHDYIARQENQIPVDNDLSEY